MSDCEREKEAISELPARDIQADHKCTAFLTINIEGLRENAYRCSELRLSQEPVQRKADLSTRLV